MRGEVRTEKWHGLLFDMSKHEIVGKRFVLPVVICERKHEKLGWHSMIEAVIGK